MSANKFTDSLTRENAAVAFVDHQVGLYSGVRDIAVAELKHNVVALAIPIIGARKLSQFQDNLASLELTLSAGELRTLDEASWIEVGFPYSICALESARSTMYGGLRDQILA